MTNLLKNLAVDTRLSIPDIERVISTAPKRYFVYNIKKRNGLLRTIAHPARELKTLQRALLNHLPDELCIHPSATAYEQGSSIKKNADVHAPNKWLAKFDITNFFNSIKAVHWIKHLESLNCEPEFIEISSRVFFWAPGRDVNMCLSVGAPSSPKISNRFMFDFDVKLKAYCDDNGLSVTRYADDIAISSNIRIEINELAEIVARCFPQDNIFTLNTAKTKMLGPGQRRTVTGLVLNNQKKASVGRKRKRLIEAQVFNYSQDNRTGERRKILGHLAFLKMVDLAGFERLKIRYGERTDLFSEPNKKRSKLNKYHVRWDDV